MNTVNKSIQWLHKFTGLTIGVFFIMWFVTGIVLLYHSYPRVTSTDRNKYMEQLIKKELPAVYDVPGLADTIAVQTLAVNRKFGETIWTISGVSRKKETPMDISPNIDGEFVICEDTLKTPKALTDWILDSIAGEWAASTNIIKVDTLYKRTQWIMYERYEKSLPILRYYFDNDDKSEVFISQKTGEVLQTTTLSQRIWSWVGAIPHKLYIPALRKDVKRWENVLLVGGLFCLVAALSGMYMGIYYLVVNKRKHQKFGSPFKKNVWRYHHIGGLIFGVFLIAWGISGSLAMQRVPKWLVNYEGDYFVSSSKLWGKKPLQLGDYHLDYHDLFNRYNDIKSISWEHFGNIPAYLIVTGTEEIYVDASCEGAVTPLNLSKEVVEQAVARYFGKDTHFSITLMENYDEYYLSRPGGYPLPVWKVDIDNADGSRMYISPTDGYVKYLNRNRMAKKWLFSATHYLGIKYFVLHETIRHICLWLLSIGCVFVCITGLGIYISKKSDL
ncbi:MAG: PepSY domain-containing protein [Bacteroides sp.]|nr:PepSY domain-containing protein [Bacteroides sp.]